MVCQENKINKKTIKGYGSAANQIGTYWNSMASILNSRTLPHVLMEHSDVIFTTKRFVRAESCEKLVSLHIYLSLFIFTYLLLFISSSLL
jgi:hypothetical protein